MMLIHPLPSIVIDGRNSARSKYGKANWSHVLLAATHFSDMLFRVFVIMPHWAGKDLIEKIREVAKIQFVDISHDAEYDDKIALGLCIVEDGYYVSNDRNMHKHLNGNLIDRTWCSSRRIGFHIDEDENFVPHYPESWRSKIVGTVEAMDGVKLITREVRE